MNQLKLRETQVVNNGYRLAILNDRFEKLVGRKYHNFRFFFQKTSPVSVIKAVAKVYYSPIDLTSNDTALSLTERLKIANYKSALFKYEVLKKEIENDPELLKTHLQNMVHSGLSDHGYHQKSKIKNHRPNLEKVNLFSMFFLFFGLICYLLKRNAFFENAY
ncbi:unnamed protein product [Wuchereria bancrofti]|uniref:Uncharacterized protein n=1 Tax=Wuchereria bancrofti TaxID=6293 RepID=A0A3P7EKM6_WUCBA|nr:unnamed protein product [Wuchereria bancrofti]